MPKRPTLGDLQLAIMRVLWTRNEATVVEVHADLLPSRQLAPTTIATMLVKMERKGVVTHRTEGRRFVYQPTLSESEVRKSMVDYVTEKLFSGDPTELLAHLITHRHVTDDEVERLQKLIESRKTDDGRATDLPPLEED